MTQHRQQQRLVLCLFDSPPEIKKTDELRRLLCLDQVIDRSRGVEHPTISSDCATEGCQVNRLGLGAWEILVLTEPAERNGPNGTMAISPSP